MKVKIKLLFLGCLLLILSFLFFQGNHGILGLKMIFKSEHILIDLHNVNQCWPLQTDITKSMAVVA